MPENPNLVTLCERLASLTAKLDMYIQYAEKRETAMLKSWEDADSRITKIETAQARAGGVIAAVAAFSSFVGAAVTAFAHKIWP